jgi:hypothetical protein
MAMLLVTSTLMVRLLWAGNWTWKAFSKAKDESGDHQYLTVRNVKWFETQKINSEDFGIYCLPVMTFTFVYIHKCMIKIGMYNTYHIYIYYTYYTKTGCSQWKWEIETARRVVTDRLWRHEHNLAHLWLGSAWNHQKYHGESASYETNKVN